MAASPVELRPVTAENWRACAGLELRPEQVGLMPDNLYSIAEAQFYPDARSLAIYLSSGELVGYLLHGRDKASGDAKVFRLMIDRAHQGRGYGKAALRLVIERVSSRGDAKRLLIAYQEHNEAARRLYAGLGFVERETDETGRVTAVLFLKKTRT